MNNTPECKAAIERCAEEVARRQPPFQVKEVPPDYIAKHVPAAPQLILDQEE